MRVKRKGIIFTMLLCLVMGGFTNLSTSVLAKTKSSPSDIFLEESVNTLAQTLLGKPYKEGGNTLSGFDTSGFVQYVLKNSRCKLTLPRTVTDQYKTGIPVKFNGATTSEDILPGDLVFFKIDEKLQSVGIFIAGPDNQFITVTKKKGVAIQNLKTKYWKKSFYGARRVIQPSPAVKRQLQEIYSSAKNGHVPNVEFGLGTKKNDIIKKWGEPKISDVGIYYDRKENGKLIAINFGLNTKDEVVSIEYTDHHKTRFSPFDILKALNSPQMYFTLDKVGLDILVSWSPDLEPFTQIEIRQIV